MVQAKLVSAIPESQPSGGTQVRQLALPDTTLYNQVLEGSVDSVRAEIDDAFADMRTFHNSEPDQIMRICGGHSARLSELRVRCQRVEDYAREWKGVRVREIELCLEELERQYAIASRLHSVRELDWKMESGGHS